MVENLEELERYAGSEIRLPQRYLDSYEFFSDHTLETEDYKILRRYGVNYLMVRAGGPLDERLGSLDGFSVLYGAPRAEYALYAVDTEWLGRAPRSHGPPG